jgi:hypothetical protein
MMVATMVTGCLDNRSQVGRVYLACMACWGSSRLVACATPSVAPQISSVARRYHNNPGLERPLTGHFVTVPRPFGPKLASHARVQTYKGQVPAFLEICAALHRSCMAEFGPGSGTCGPIAICQAVAEWLAENVTLLLHGGIPAVKSRLSKYRLRHQLATN